MPLHLRTPETAPYRILPTDQVPTSCPAIILRVLPCDTPELALRVAMDGVALAPNGKDERFLFPPPSGHHAGEVAVGCCRILAVGF